MRTLLVDALATYRLARLVTTDTLPPAKAFRAAIIRRYGPESAVAELVHCPWCVGVWAAAGVVTARRIAPRMWDPVATGLALAAAAGWLASRE